MQNLIKKITSRKFWICVSAFLGSMATSIYGLHTKNDTIVIIGEVCAILSVAIYTACEAWIDSKSVKRDTLVIIPKDDKSVTNESEV